MLFPGDVDSGADEVVRAHDPESQKSIRRRERARSGATNVAPEKRIGRELVLKPKLRLIHKRPLLPYAFLSNSVESFALMGKDGSEAILAPCSVNVLKTIISLALRVNMKKDKDFWTHKTTRSELSRDIGLDYTLSIKQVRSLLWEAKGYVCEIRLPNGWRYVSVLEKAELIDDVIWLKLDERMKQYLLQLPDKFSKMYPNVLKLGSWRAMLLYLCLRQPAGEGMNPKRRYSLPDLQRRLHCEGVPFKEFRRYLAPWLKNINQKTELKASYKAERMGKKVGSLMFTVRENQQKLQKLLPYFPEKAGKND
jgi:hypothetical protein